MGSSTALVFVFMALIVGVESCTLRVKNCGSKKGKVESVGFNGTCASGAAVLKKGTFVQLQISLDSNDDSNNLTAVVHGIIAGVPIPFPLGDPNACKGCNITCPVKKGKHYDYSPVIDVLHSYPSISLVVKWELKDDNGDDLLCLEIPVRIES